MKKRQARSFNFLVPGVGLEEFSTPEQNTPQITFHLLYIETLQQVECGILYIQQSIPQITIHLLYIDTLQQMDCDKMY
jgi:hypothetical protein